MAIHERAAVCHGVGKRSYQEDTHVYSTWTVENIGSYELFGIIDGHAGKEAAQFVQQHIAKEVKKAEKPVPPVFLALENFIVNLQSENGDKYLQTGITLQVRDEEQSSYYKANMPQLRSRILLLLSSKSADDLLTSEGKKQLEDDLIKQVQQPYNNEEPTPKEAEEHRILGVYFTSFMIQ